MMQVVLSWRLSRTGATVGCAESSMEYPSLLSLGRLLAGGLGAALCTLLGLPVHASGALEIAGAPTSSNGMTSRSLGRHAETAYFNPGLLPRTGPLVEVGYFLLHVHGNIRLDPRPDGVDVPPSLYDAEIRNPNGSVSRLNLRPLATEDLPNARQSTLTRDTSSYALVGIARPLFQDAVTFGLFAILPTRGVLSQHGFFADEREQFFSNRLDFEMLGDRTSLSSFALAIGGRPWRWLGIGVGANLALSTTTRFEIYVPDAADQRTLLLNPDMSTSASFAPYGGVALQPSDKLTVAATLHAPVSADVSGENLVRFWNYNYPDDEQFVRQTYIFSQCYQPLRVGFGAAWTHRNTDSGDSDWQLGMQTVLRRWSQYQNRHGARPEEPFDDTLEISVGGAFTNPIGLLSLDLGFVPSPVPDQVGRTSYVDNDRLMAQAGLEIPLEVFGSETSVGVYLQGQLLVPRKTSKRANALHPVIDEFPDASTDFVTGDPIAGAEGLQTNNPGYPGYESSGWMMGAGLAFRLPQ